jgi:hypothetical protein
MKPDDQPKEESIAGTDEFFKDHPVLPEEPPAPDNSATAPADSEMVSASNPPESSPLQDYVRELQAGKSSSRPMCMCDHWLPEVQKPRERRAPRLLTAIADKTPSKTFDLLQQISGSLLRQNLGQCR